MSNDDRFLQKIVAPLAASAIAKLVNDFKKGLVKVYLDGNNLRIVDKNKKNSFDYTLSFEEAKRFFTNLFKSDN